MGAIVEVLNTLNGWSVLFRIFLSVILGGCIGLERGRHGRAAGLRTHILVCLGATLATLVGVFAVSELHFSSDPLRIGAQVVSGIGFLGVGTIMIRNHSHVTGLTTAAGLWATACIGLAIGIGFYIAAFASFVAVIITVTLFIYLEKFSKSQDAYICYVELMVVENVKDLHQELSHLITGMDVIPAKSGISTHIGLEFKTNSMERHQAILQATKDRDDVVISLPIQI